MTNTNISMPALFLAHGNPMHALDSNQYTQSWQDLAKGIPRPDAIILLSAHWFTPGSFACTVNNPETIHDFGGFPQALFDVQYPAPGANALAEEICRAVPAFKPSTQWGLDHGAWSLLVHLFPDADIPVCQLSIDYQADPQAHFELGRNLAWLRQRNVLVIGSGNVVHNIAKWHNPGPSNEWAFQFDAAFEKALSRRDFDSLINYQQMPCYEEAVPTPEHYLPALYIAAMAGEKDTIQQTTFTDGSTESACMRSFAVRSGI